MLVAVVLDRDHRLLPTHVEVGDRNTVRTRHWYLGLRPGQARVDEQQAQVALAGRLRAGVDQLERGLQRPKSRRARVVLRNAEHIIDLKPVARASASSRATDE